ncbi:MAG: tripartite tricarboxylate transporter TctB family protein [Acidobacteria bacterium]|nr:tripartite tricarboxylate transporter TctB family protein [Acidobacteriota bacterium]
MFADLALALSVTALGACLAVGSTGISLGTGYDRIGPRFFPYLVAMGLMLLGSWLAVAAIRGNRAKPVAEENDEPDLQMNWPINWSALGYLALALLLNLALMERAGFVISSSVLFWLAARAFHSRRPARDAAVAVLLSILVYFAFTRGLGLILPLGIFNRLF